LASSVIIAFVELRNVFFIVSVYMTTLITSISVCNSLPTTIARITTIVYVIATMTIFLGFSFHMRALS